MSIREEKISGMDASASEIIPVMGWLVCTKGPMRGQDFRLSGGFNRMGSRVSDDIIIPGDEAEIGSVVCDGRFGVTYLVVDGNTPVLLNGRRAEEVTVLHSEDVISVYDMEYRLILFCPDQYQWENEDE